MWEVVPLGNKVKLIPGYAFNTSDFVSEGVPLIRMGNLYQNKLGLTRAPKYLPLGFIEKHNKFVIKENDIVFSMTGTSGKEDYGFAVKIPESSPLCLLNQRVAKIVAGDGLKVNFLLHLLHSRTFLDEIYAVGTGTKQANLSATHIINVELAFPPLNEQVKIASALDSVSNHILVIKEKLAKLKNTNKALMQDLLTGKIRVNTESINTEVAVG
jgi:type I restriction enzyme S subunit